LRSQGTVRYFEHNRKYIFAPPAIPARPLHVVYKPIRVGKEGITAKTGKEPVWSYVMLGG
jgi:hypothetical protein